MNVKPVLLNTKEDTIQVSRHSCRPTPAHYRETADKLLEDLLFQNTIGHARDQRSE